MLRILISCILVVMLTGCPAGIAPIVGYSKGETANQPTLSCSSGTGLTSRRIYDQKIDQNYRLLFSPEGGYANYPLKHSHRYYFQLGKAPMKELVFLRSASKRGESFDMIHPMAGTDRWVGFGLCSGAPVDDSSFAFLPGAGERAHQTSRYFITVFDQNRIISRREVITKMRNPSLRYMTRLHAVQFNGPSGRMLYLTDENRVVKELSNAY